MMAGVALATMPAMGAILLEVAGTVDKMGRMPEDLYLAEWAQRLPFPLLYNIFENASDNVRILVPAGIVAVVGALGAGTLLGKAINKLRYVTRGMQLKHQANQERMDTYRVMDTYREESRENTAKQAYLNTRGEYFSK